MKFPPTCIAVLVGLNLSAQFVRANTECPAYLPAGVVIRMFPDEKLVAGSSSGPTIFTVTSDIRFFPNRPPLLARGSKVLGTIIESKDAGHFYGKARLKITLQSILTSDLCEYPIDAKVIEAGQHKVKDEVILGRGHAERDVIALLFPPTTMYQLLRIPSRGPNLKLDNETALNIKLMQSVSLAEGPARLSGNNHSEPTDVRDARIDPIEESDHRTSERCSPNYRPALPMTLAASILRPVRNLTPYHVSLYVDNKPVLILPPCYGPSMIATPNTEFQIEAIANLLTAGGQKRIALKVVPDAGGKGWDVVTPN
jgi:hypothetical protein